MPSRYEAFGARAIASMSLAALAVGAILGPAAHEHARLAVSGVAVAIAIASVPRGPAEVRSLTLLVAALAVSWEARVLWQLAMAFSLIAALVAGRLVARFRTAGNPLNRGRFSALGVALVGGVTPVALAAWIALARPDLSDVLARYVPPYPLPVLVLGGVAFAFVNAALEEAIWRGFFQTQLSVLFGPWTAIAIQAASFGIQHAHGVPRGAVGVLLAGTWGAMLGALRRRTGGLAAPFVAHVIADSTIACIVLFVIRK